MNEKCIDELAVGKRKEKYRHGSAIHTNAVSDNMAL
jgi:hypothetical protein